MHISRVKKKKPSSLRHLLVIYSRTFKNTTKKEKENKNKTKKNKARPPFMFTNNGQVFHLHEFNYRLVTVTQISSDGEVTRR